MPSDRFRLLKFEKSKVRHKKYNAVLIDITTRREQRVPFGDNRYSQYFDSTPLKLYSKLNHNDNKRKKNYLARHAKTLTKKFSPSYFSAKYLWDANI